MRTAVIIDAVTAAVLLGFVICGARRGLLHSVAGLVIVLAALVGAGYLSALLTPYAAAYVQPILEKRIESRMDAALGIDDASSAESGADSAAGSIEAQTPPIPGGSSDASAVGSADRLMALLKLDRDPAGTIVSGAKEELRDAGVSAVTAVAQSTAESFLHAVLFALCFGILLLVLRLAAGALDLVAQLPGLHLANRLGGAALGAAEGVLALFLAVWVLRRFGVRFDTAAVERTYLLSFFTTHTPLDMLSFL